MKAVEQTPTIYMFVGRKNEAQLCAEFIPQIKAALNYYIPDKIITFSSYSNDDLLALYTFTGGVPKYVELFCDNILVSSAKVKSLALSCSRNAVNLLQKPLYFFHFYKFKLVILLKHLLKQIFL